MLIHISFNVSYKCAPVYVTKWIPSNWTNTIMSCRFLKQNNKRVGVLKNANILENHRKVKCATVACQQKMQYLY